jgi:hypothetical protein
MKKFSPHSFHIPVMGLAFTIESPVKVAKYGINSVVSIVEDELIESMREVISKRENRMYRKIEISEPDFRAKRITAYLNLMNDVSKEQLENIRRQDFENGEDIRLYFDLLPENSTAKRMYLQMQESEGDDKLSLQTMLREYILAGSIDVNIMTKIDKVNYDSKGNELESDYSDALSALRGYALSDLSSSIVFSAGMNPRLFSYCEKFDDFYPDAKGFIKKKIILKVSDFRSALIQGKYLAKKGLWVSEYRIESGINCGGHAFISGGILIGPILEEFKSKRNQLLEEVFNECEVGLKNANRPPFYEKPELKITAQGGIGTAYENSFLNEYYQIDATGWGSPFLLVPEATTLDEDTLQKLSKAKKEDYYLSHASPLGVPFNNFRNSSSEAQRVQRLSKNRPGSPCYKKFLISNKEFTDKPICTASREYQKQKLEELQEKYSAQDPILQTQIDRIIEKECLCEGLGASALIVNGAKLSHKLSAVAICPGPNLAYFSGTFSLKEMVDHIYGRINILNALNRPILFINELQLYVDYLVEDIKKNLHELTDKKTSYYKSFKNNLIDGIHYYEELFSKMKQTDSAFQLSNIDLLESIKIKVNSILFSTEPKPV